MGRAARRCAASARARAARSTMMYEVPLKAGHFGLVVGSTALDRDLADRGRVDAVARGRRRRRRRARSTCAPPTCRIRSHERTSPTTTTTMPTTTTDDARLRARDASSSRRPRSAALERLGELSEDLGDYLDNARWQLPRLDAPAQPAGRLADLARQDARRSGARDRRPHVLPVARPRVHLRRGEPARRRRRARPDRVRRARRASASA